FKGAEDYGVLERAVAVEEVGQVEVGIDRLGGPPHVVVGVEEDVEVDADLLEPVGGDGEEACLDVDLQGSNLAQLRQQAFDGAVVVGGIGDDEVAVEFLQAAGLATEITPAFRI